MFASVGAWFYRALAGINQDTDSVGYRHVRIEPHPVEDLHWASGTIQTIRGAVSSSWAHSPGVIRLDVVIPVGADATVLIPKEQQMTDIRVREGNHIVWEDGHYVAGDPGDTGATGGGEDREHLTGVTLHLGSGEYSLVLTGR